MTDLTRRDLLKLGGAGLLALAMSNVRLEEAQALESPASFQGRATFSGVQMYEAPSFKAVQTPKKLGKDEVLDVQALTIGDGDYNRIWYRTPRGFTYSGWLQPVQTQHQPVVTSLPRSRVLGEVTVPFAETRRYANPYADRSYRMYYGSTHWVTNLFQYEDDGSWWYEVFDKQADLKLYVNTTDMRLMPDAELAPLSPNVPEAQKFIHVDLRTQYVTAFEGEKMVYRSRCSSGAGPKTPLGDFRTYHKGPSIHMTNEGDDTNHVYNLPGVPWTTFFTGNGEAFHGTYWHNDFGKPRSHGCVNLPNVAAKFIYRWTTPVVPPDTDYLYMPGSGVAVTVVKPEVKS
jgi:lipoprotein-anchoring transpeptidase ErfK/SrfK